ncbi:MAG: hypothetical protein J0M17_17810 [Planctomycetes bacterium]|nr:hypothetical protein [Planctomycetota bacterium]
MKRTLLVALILLAGAIASLTDGRPLRASDSAEFFARRILPIARAQRASSCTECHFAGVELGQYVLDDEASTFAALRAAGLIDVAQPEQSKLLAFIRRKPEREDATMAKVRAEESAAFTAWITAAAKNPELLSKSGDAPPIGTQLPPEVVRHVRSDRLLASFVENIWVEMERCINCHSPERNERWVKEHGKQVSWLVPRDPAATMKYLADEGLIDVDAPEKSLLLLKPLGAVEHAGHVKFAVGSRTDRQFRRFLNDYAATVAGKYKTTGDLPPPTKQLAIATGQQLKITEMPTDQRGRLIRVLLYPRDGEAWSTRPIASGDSQINPQDGTWMNQMCELVDREQATPDRLLKPRLLPGERYLAKLYIVDATAATKPNFEFGDADFYGSAEVSGNWHPGWQKPKTIAAGEIVRE